MSYKQLKDSLYEPILIYLSIFKTIFNSSEKPNWRSQSIELEFTNLYLIMRSIGLSNDDIASLLSISKRKLDYRTNKIIYPVPYITENHFTYLKYTKDGTNPFESVKDFSCVASFIPCYAGICKHIKFTKEWGDTYIIIASIPFSHLNPSNLKVRQNIFNFRVEYDGKNLIVRPYKELPYVLCGNKKERRLVKWNEYLSSVSSRRRKTTLKK